ncbi:MAG: hypothetical protein GWP91_03835 [Rhodobacterales bacterium]|nr:hypothetical protein [Rhodobacterales bacterium]
MRLKLWLIAALMLAQTACLEGFSTLFTTVRYDATTQAFEVERVLVNVDESFFQCSDNESCIEALDRALRKEPGHALGGSLADRLLRRLLDGGAVEVELELQPHDGQLDVVLRYQAPAGSQAARATMVQAEWGGEPGREKYYLVVESQSSMVPPKRYETRKAAVGEGDWREYWVLPRNLDQVTTELTVDGSSGSIFETAPGLLAGLQSLGWLDDGAREPVALSVVEEPVQPTFVEERMGMVPEPEVVHESEIIVAPESAVIVPLEPEVISEAEPEVISAPEPVVVVEPEPDVVAGPEPKVIAVLSPEVIAEPEPEIIAAPEPEIIAAPEPVVIAEPEPEVIAAPEPVVIAEPEPEVIAAPEPVVIAAPEPVVIAEPEPVVIAEPEPIAQPEPEPQVVIETAVISALEPMSKPGFAPDSVVAVRPAAPQVATPAIWPRPASDSRARVYAFDPQLTNGISALQAISASGHLLPRVEWCYQDRAAIDPSLGGTIFLSALVRADGLVLNTSVSGELRDEALRECLNRAVQDWNFKPWGSGDSIADVILPFTLRVEEEAQRKRKRP